jgi:MoaA/NifB/PqqE/SkfB family radical SAM enzyme
MTVKRLSTFGGETQPRVIIELTNTCNLHCSYCSRDDDALHHSPAQFMPVDLVRRIVKGAREAYGCMHASFTGGEVTIHPHFREIVQAVREEGLKFGFVTNGWHFDRVCQTVLDNRDAVRGIGFSVDGATREAHDYWRGEGSFVRLMKSVTKCYVHCIPFTFKVGIRRDTIPQLEQIVLLAARMGAKGVLFSHLLPTSMEVEDESALSLEERRHVEQEICILASIFKITVGIAVGYYNIDPEPPCDALLGQTSNVDYRGRLSLCCNLSGYRNADGEPDVVADLTREDFATAYERLSRIAGEQVLRRQEALASFAESDRAPDLYTASPCLFCLKSFSKIPWRADANHNSRTLPILNSN